MKTTKKILSLLMALVMALSLCTGMAFAADYAPTGNITVENAQIGNTYTAYHIFDATWDTIEIKDSTGKVTDTKTAITYTTDNAELIALIEAQQKDDPAEKTPVCPFEIVSKVNGVATVQHRDNVQETQGRGWLKSTLETWSANLSEDNGIYTKECTEGNTVVFEGVPVGYFMIQPKDGGNTNYVTVNTNTPDATVIDKNPTTPGNPSKVDDKDPVVVGEKVTYTAAVRATNFLTTGNGTNANTWPVENFTFTDTYTKGLTFDAETGIKSIKLYSEVNEDGTVDSSKLLYKDAEKKVPYEIADYTLTADTDGEFTINIPWADKEDSGKKDSKGNIIYNFTALYPSPCYIVVEYEMTVNKDILETLKLQADNTIKVTYDANGVANPTGDVPPVSVYTTGVSLAKRDINNTNTPLEGAEFVLYKLDKDNNKLYYHENKDGSISWVPTKDFTSKCMATGTACNCEFKASEAVADTNKDVFLCPDCKQPVNVTVTCEDGHEMTIKPSDVVSGKVTCNHMDGQPATACSREIVVAEQTATLKCTNKIHTSADPYLHECGIDKAKDEWICPACNHGIDFTTKCANGHDVTIKPSDYDAGKVVCAKDGCGDKIDLTCATFKIADNDYNTLEFMGLAEGTYYIEETKAPKGYELPATPDTLVVKFDENTKNFEMTLTGHEKDNVQAQAQNPDWFSAYIHNGTHAAMPVTGGAGTYVMIACGAALFVAAAVVLVTKKRMYNEG
ncbi:MAG: hypothetical protein KBS74_02990 [Clostridiales bacterium]|nr:hypothetical protein [Candidatus Cacconaster stercorequi]